MKLPSLPADKANHALYGAIVFLVASAVAAQAFGLDQVFARGFGLLAALGVGVWKEIGHDARLNRDALASGEPPPHESSWQDAAHTAAGAAVCWAAAALSTPGVAL